MGPGFQFSDRQRIALEEMRAANAEAAQLQAVEPRALARRSVEVGDAFVLRRQPPLLQAGPSKCHAALQGKKTVHTCEIDRGLVCGTCGWVCGERNCGNRLTFSSMSNASVVSRQLPSPSARMNDGIMLEGPDVCAKGASAWRR